MSRRNYAQIKNIGPSTVPINYLSACLDNTIDAGFLTGAPPQTWNSRSKECQALLSQYVAADSSKDQFNGVSLAAINLQGRGFPNQNGSGLFNYNLGQGGFLKEQNYGTQILDDAGYMKYCAYDQTNISLTNVNPSDPSSPLVPVMSGTWIKPLCSVDPKIIDNDPLMNSILQQPEQHVGLLSNIRKNSPNLDGTKLGRLFKDNANYFNKLSL